MKSKAAIIFSLGLTLSACVNEPQIMNDVHTGVNAGISRSYPGYQNLLVSVNTQAFVAERNNEIAYGIYINQIATMQGWSFFQEAYSFGTKLEYIRGNEEVLDCNSACTTREQGLIKLSEKQFMDATKSGFEGELVGDGNSVVIKVPAIAFQEALSIKQ
jgi:hypothetical protein